MENLTAIRFALAEVTAEAVNPTAAAHAGWEHTDAVVAEAPGRSTWACGRGCAACCHLLVRLHPAETEAIAEHVRAALPSAVREALLERLAEVATTAEGLDAAAYRHRRIRCAFLDEDDGCRIYDQRPVVCRVHASRSAEGCADLERRPPLDTWLSKVGRAIHAGLGDASLEEMHGALRDRLESDG